jgi:hypothetical protein
MSGPHHQDASSGDTAFDQAHEKHVVDTPTSEQMTEAPVAAQPDNEVDNVTEKTEGSPLDRAPSQAAKMGKKKIIIVMGALCVRKPATHSPIR